MKAASKKNSTSTAKSSTSLLDKGGAPSFFQTTTGSPFYGKSNYGNAPIQAKLNVGKPNDKYEKEADAVADNVVQRLAVPEKSTAAERGIQAKPIGSAISPLVQTKCAACEQEEKLQKKEEGLEENMPSLMRKAIFESNEEPENKLSIQRKCHHCEMEEKGLQRKETANAATTASPSVESNLSHSKGSGTPLPASVNSSMSNAFGTDFSKVRVHTDCTATQMSRQLNAQAFTHGSDIYFNSGKFETTSRSGQHLLAHELTHTVQQSGGGSGELQKKPGNDSCSGNPPEVLSSVDAVTKKCPTDKGEISGKSGNYTISIAKLKVKENAPKSLLKSLGKDWTLPKPGSRKDNPTEQVGLWGKSVKPDVTSSYETLLSGINKDQDLESKKNSKNKYSVLLKTGNQVAQLTGNFSELVNGALVSKWNSKGSTRAFQVEHILDYQVAGDKADIIENLMLLSAAINNDLGAKMREFIRNDINALLKHYSDRLKPGTLVSKADEAREQYTIKAKDFERVENNIKEDEEILTDTLKEKDKDPLRKKIVEIKPLNLKKGEFILISNKKGGGIILPYKKKSFDVGSYKLTTDGNATDGTISKITAKQIIEGSHTEDQPEEIEYKLTPVPGEAHTYKADEFGNQMANLKLKYLSLIKFNAPEIDEGLNVKITGSIDAPSPKFLNNTPIEVLILGRDIIIQKTFSADNLGSVGPIKVDSAALTINVSTLSGFGASGNIDFSIPNAGKGSIEASGNSKGFILTGGFDFDSKIFEKAGITVSYSSALDKEGKDPWTFNGILTIVKDKVKGINSATVTVSYGQGVLHLEGATDLDVPGIKSAKITADYKKGGDFKLVVAALFDFKSKFIQNPNITITLSSGGEEGGGAWSLGISGNADLVIPNFKTVQLSVSYLDGKFDANANIKDLSAGKYITGEISLGATNATVDEATGVAAAAGNGKTLSLYGSGSITVKLGENISSTVKVKYTKAGKILISGKLEVTDQPLLKGPLFEFNRELFKIGTPNIPIFSIGIGDIFLRIEGAGNVMALVKSPVISISVNLNDTDIFNPQGFEIASKITPKIEAEAGLDLGIKFIIGARALVLEISANIGGTVGLHIKAGAKASLDMTWSSKNGFQFKHAEGVLDGDIVISGAITGGVSVDLNLFLTRINIWKKDWDLAKMDFGSLGKMSFKFPVDFNADGSAKAIDPTNKLQPESAYSNKEGTERMLNEKAGGGKNKVEKKPEDFNKEISSFLASLPSYGPGNPKYNEQRSKHFFINEIESNYKDGDWKWLRQQWFELEMNEFRNFENEMTKSSLIQDKVPMIEKFASDHVQVPRTEIDKLIQNIKKVENLPGTSLGQNNFTPSDGTSNVQTKGETNQVNIREDNPTNRPVFRDKGELDNFTQKENHSNKIREERPKTPKPLDESAEKDMVVQRDTDPVTIEQTNDQIQTWDPETVLMEYLSEYEDEKEAAETSGEEGGNDIPNADGPSAWIGTGAKGLRKTLMIKAVWQKLSNDIGYKNNIIELYKDNENPADVYINDLQTSLENISDSERKSLDKLNELLEIKVNEEDFIDNYWFKVMDGGNAFPGLTWIIVKKLISPPEGLVSDSDTHLSMSERYYNSYKISLGLDMFYNGLPVSYGYSLVLSYFELIRNMQIDKLDKLPDQDWMKETFIQKSEQELFSDKFQEFVKSFAYYGVSKENAAILKYWAEISTIPWLRYDTRAISDFRKEFPTGFTYLDQFYDFEYKGIGYSLSELLGAVLFGLSGIDGLNPYTILGKKSSEARNVAPEILQKFVASSLGDFNVGIHSADEMITNLSAAEKLEKGVDWSISKGFAGESIKMLLDHLDDILIDILKQWGQDTAIKKGASFIVGTIGGPIGRLATFIYNAYDSYQKAQDLIQIAELANDVFNVVNEAKDSKSVIQSQRAAAKMAELTATTIPLLIQLLGSKILSKIKEGHSKDNPEKISEATRKDSLDKSHEMETVSDLAKEPKYLHAELDTAAAGTIRKSSHPDYDIEVLLPNNHTWRRKANGVWCRFSEVSCILSFKDLPNESVRKELEELDGKADAFKESLTGDMLSKEEYADLNEVKHPPGANEVNPKTTLGTFVHSKAYTQFCAWLDTHHGNDWLKKNNLTHADFVLDLPQGNIQREFEIKVEGYTMKQRADIVDFDNATVHEIKPAGSEHKGFAEAQQYAEWLNKYHPRDDNRLWTAGATITYDADKVFKIFKSFGYFK